MFLPTLSLSWIVYGCIEIQLKGRICLPWWLKDAAQWRNPVARVVEQCCCKTTEKGLCNLIAFWFFIIDKEISCFSVWFYYLFEIMCLIDNRSEKWEENLEMFCHRCVGGIIEPPGRQRVWKDSANSWVYFYVFDWFLVSFLVKPHTGK